MRVNQGETSVKSGIGACFTFLLFMVLLVYSAQKTSILIAKGDTRVNEYDIPYHFDIDHEFGYDDGFNVAFFFGNIYNPQTFDRSYGHFNVTLYEWGLTEDNIIYTRET